MPKHTTTEWKIAEGQENFVYALNEQGTNRFCLSITAGNITHSPSERTSDEEIAANARLIVAAPKMYEILENLRESNVTLPAYIWEKITKVTCEYMETITPVIGKRHRTRGGRITKVIVSSEGTCPDHERYPYMEEGNTVGHYAWATKGQWDDRGSEWEEDIVEVIN